MFLTAEDWDEVSSELGMLRAWALTTHAADESDYVIQRIDRLLRELPPHLAAGAEVWIG